MKLIQKPARFLCTVMCVLVLAQVDIANATGVGVGTNLVATFNENVAKGTGDITIVETGVGTFEVIPVTSGQVSVSGRAVTINPSGTLADGTSYHVLIDATAIDDMSGNSFAGISGSTTWNFAAGATGCLPSTTAWTNNAFANQSTPFEVQYDATPEGPNIDGLVGLSLGNATDFASLAVTTRFNVSGMIDARNDDIYSADALVSYVPGTTYHFRLVIDPAAKRYDIYVTPAGSGEIVLGTGYAFRTQQNTVSSLDTWAMRAGIGSQTVCNFAVSFISSDTTPPSIPSNLSTSLQPPSGVDLTWSASTDNVGVTGYSVERCVGATCTGFVQIIAPNGPSYSDTGLLPNVTYRYRVRSMDVAGNSSPYSSIVSATPLDTTPPSVPSNLSTSLQPPSAVDLTWGASTDDVGVASYNVERCVGASCTGFVQIGTTSGSSYSDTGLLPNLVYRYRVRATDAAGNSSPYSSIVSPDVTAPLLSSTPFAPADGSIGVTVGTNLVATFNENVAKGTGNITIFETGVGSFEVIPVSSGQVSVSGAVVTINPAGTLQLGTAYHVQIEATAIDDTAGNSFAGISGSTTWNFAAGATGCLPSTTAWTNNAFANQSTPFEVQYDATPEGPNIDGLVGLSLGNATDFASLAVTTRFNVSGMIDARNDDIYSADALVSYVPGTTYHFRLVIDPAAKRYDIYVTPAGSGEIVLGTGYAFRTQQNTVSSLDTWAMRAGIGSQTVCNFAVSSFPSDTTAPTVTLTEPAVLATVVGTTNVSANASDDTGVVGVQFLLDGVNLSAEFTAPPYTLVWETSTAPEGARKLNAVARDAAGNQSLSADVWVTVTHADATAPTVTLTEPVAFAAVIGTTNVSANASDDTGVVGVQFLLDGVNLGGEVTSPPYTLVWETSTAPEGARKLNAVARDAAGNQSLSADVWVTVTHADATAPTVTLTEPVAFATVIGMTNVSANASDDTGVTSVQFLLDGVNLGGAFTAPAYALAWDTSTAPEGPHKLNAVAQDAAGNQSISADVWVTVTHADTTAPTVTLTEPAILTTVIGTTNVSANASDDTSVTSVQFLLDGVNLGGAFTAPPYTLAWDTGTAPEGPHKLNAVAQMRRGTRAFLRTYGSPSPMPTPPYPRSQ